MMEGNEQTVTPEARLRAIGGASGVVLAAGALLSVVNRMVEDAANIGTALATPPNIILGILVGGALIYSLLQIIDALRKRPRFAPASQAIADLAAGKVLIGREEEKRELEHLVDASPEVHIVGQEGVGKTGLLNALRGKLAATGSRFRPLTVASWTGGFATGPLTRLGDEVWQALTPEQRTELGVAASIRPADLERVLGRFREVTGARPLVIVDQVEDHQMLHCERLFQDGHPIDRDALVGSNPFWALLRSLVENETIHLIVARSAGTRIPKLTDDAAELGIHRIPTIEVDAYFNTTLTPQVTNADRGWKELSRAIVDDLAGSNGVMPRHLVFVCSELAQMPRLTASEYEITDRLDGMAARLIERAIGAIAESRSADPAVLTAAVRLLASSESSLTLKEIQERLGPGDAPVLAEALSDLQHKGILRQRVDPARCVTVWAPMHSFITGGITKLGDSSNRWKRLLEQRAAAHAQSDWKSWWRTLLRPSLQIALFYHRLRGDLRYGQFRRFAAGSALRFVPYLLPPLLYLYLVGAERAWPVPFQSPVRDFLYVHGIELTKHVVIDEQIAQKARDARLLLVQTINGNRKQGEWFQPAMQPEGKKESWIQAQALAALANTPEFHDRRRWLKREVGALFGSLIRDAAGKPVGWLPNENAVHTQAEPALWAASAMAGLSGSHTDDEFNEFRARVGIVQACADAFGPRIPRFDGGWNMFPNQRDTLRHSTYSSALALTALLDSRRANLPWDGSDASRDLLIRQTAAWLTRTYDARTMEWYPTPSDPKPQPGLTYQGYAALLRAANEADVPLPRNIVADVPVRLERLINVDVTTDASQTAYDGWQKVQLTNHLGKAVSSEAPAFKYAQLPWGIETATQWLKYTEAHGAPTLRQRAIVRRVRDHLVMDELPLAVTRYRGSKSAPAAEYTFWGAELLYCLDSIPAPHGGSTP